MARSKTFVLGIVLTALAASAQNTGSPIPTDIPWSVNVTEGTFRGDDGMLWTADAGVYLNDGARNAEKDAIKELRDQNNDLQAKLKEKTDEAVAQTITPEGWVGIATSIIGTVGAAVAAVVAATQKH